MLLTKSSMIPYIIDGSTFPDGLELTFSSINWRKMEEHPIETVLVDDVLHKIGRERKENVGIITETLSRQKRKVISVRNVEKSYLRVLSFVQIVEVQ